MNRDISSFKLAMKILGVVAILALIAGIVWVAVAGIWSLATDLSFVEVWQTWFHCLPAKEVVEEGGEVVTAVFRNAA